MGQQIASDEIDHTVGHIEQHRIGVQLFRPYSHIQFYTSQHFFDVKTRFRSEGVLGDRLPSVIILCIVCLNVDRPDRFMSQPVPKETSKTRGPWIKGIAGATQLLYKLVCLATKS